MKLKDSFKVVATQTGASFEDIATSVGTVSQRTGATGKDLEALSLSMLRMSSITGKDLGSVLESTTKLFNNFQIPVEQMPAAMDKLYVASAKTGVGVDQLSSSAQTFGPVLRQLGFGFDDSIALLASFDKAGVNTGKVTAGMGVALGNLAKTGATDLPAAFGKTVDAINSAGTQAEANSIAVELFGKRAGPQMAEAIRSGAFSIGDLTAQLGDAEGALGKTTAETVTFAGKMAKFKNQMKVAFEPAAMGLFTSITDALISVTPLLTSFAGLIGSMVGVVSSNKAVLVVFAAVFGTLVTAIVAAKVAMMAYQGILNVVRVAQLAWTAAVGVAKVAMIAFNAVLMVNPFVLIAVAIVALIAGLVLLYTKVDWFRKGVDAAFGAIVSVAQSAFGWIKSNSAAAHRDTRRPVRSRGRPHHQALGLDHRAHREGGRLVRGDARLDHLGALPVPPDAGRLDLGGLRRADGRGHVRGQHGDLVLLGSARPGGRRGGRPRRPARRRRVLGDVGNGLGGLLRGRQRGRRHLVDPRADHRRDRQPRRLAVQRRRLGDPGPHRRHHQQDRSDRIGGLGDRRQDQELPPVLAGEGGPALGPRRPAVLGSGDRRLARGGHGRRHRHRGRGGRRARRGRRAPPGRPLRPVRGRPGRRHRHPWHAGADLGRTGTRDRAGRLPRRGRPRGPHAPDRVRGHRGEALMLRLELAGVEPLDLDDYENGLIVAQVDTGWPEVREVVDPLPDRDGVADSTRLMGQRVVSLTGTAVATNGRSRQEVLDRLRRFCVPNVRPTLTVASPGEQPRRITLRGDQHSAPFVHPEGAAFAVSWRSADPRFYALDRSSLTVKPPASTGEGRHYDLTHDRTYPPAYGGSGTVDVVNAGDVETWPTFLFYGPIVDPMVTNLETGDALAFLIDIADRDYLVVETAPRAVYLNGDRNADRYANVEVALTTWFAIRPGRNRLRLTAAGYTSPAEVRIDWTDAYL